MRSAAGRVWDFIKVLTLFGVVAFVSAYLADYAGEEYSGTARVIDGDSLEVGGQEIRLFGIDAPEFSQDCQSSTKTGTFSCGREALKHLKRLIGGRVVHCDGWEMDKFQRLLATCKAGDVLLNERMVRDGWAVAYGDYAGLEFEAMQAKRGLWAGEFKLPAQWRTDRREAHSPSLFRSLKFW